MHNPAGVSIATEEAISKADIFYHLLLLFGIHKCLAHTSHGWCCAGRARSRVRMQIPPPFPRLNCIFLSPGEYFSNWFDLGRLQLLVYISTSICKISLSLSSPARNIYTQLAGLGQQQQQPKLNWKPTEVICHAGPIWEYRTAAAAAVLFCS